MELRLNDGEVSVEDFLNDSEDQVLVTGHTHTRNIHKFSKKVYINTGTWTNMHNLDFVNNIK